MQKTSQNPLIYLIAALWRYSKGNRPNVLKYATFSIISNCVIAVEPLLIGIFINSIQTSGITQSNAIHVCLLLSVLMLIEIVFWAFHGYSRVTENDNAFHVRANYKKYMLEGVMDLPIEWQSDHHSGNTIDKIEKGANAIFSFSTRTFEIITAVISLTSAIGILLFYDRVGGLLVIGISITAFGVMTLFDRVLIPGYRRVNSIENATSAKLFDVLSNITTVIILRIEKLVFISFSESLNKSYTQYRKNLVNNEWKWFSASIFGRLAIILSIGAYILIHVRSGGIILIGTLYILYGYADRVRDTFYKFAYLYNDIVRYKTSVDNGEEVAKDFLQKTSLGNHLLPTGWQSLAIENLSFSYHGEDHDELHIDGVSMTLRKGERVAVIGDSGGGKSTFLKLLRDLYHPRSANLTLDGKPLADGFSTIADSISLIPQDPEIFATTIRENITLGVDYSDEHIEVFTDMARFTEVVKRLPHKLESSIVEKGVNLSGGEKQRLALSRGLLASLDKEIVLLDEPTSSIDTVNELAIYKNIFEAFPGKTIISSIHRLHLLELFDSIYFFRDGKIIASGTFAELQKTSPEFKTLWKAYMKKERT